MPYPLEANPDPLGIINQSVPRNVIMLIKKDKDEIELFFKARSPSSAAFEVQDIRECEDPLELNYRYYRALKLVNKVYPINNVKPTSGGNSPGALPNPQFEKLYDALKDENLAITDTSILIAASYFPRRRHRVLSRLYEKYVVKSQGSRRKKGSSNGLLEATYVREKLQGDQLYISDIIVGTNSLVNIQKVVDSLPKGAAFFVKSMKEKGKKDFDSLLQRPLSYYKAVSRLGNFLSEFLGYHAIRENIIVNIEELQLLTRLPRNLLSYPFLYGLPASRIVGKR